MDVGAVLTGLALLANVATILVLIWQARIMNRSFMADHERRCNQATIEYMNNIRKEYRPINKKLVDKFGDDVVINMKDIDPSLRDDIIELLSIVEHMSVGVNSCVYSVDMIERMSGTYILSMHRRLEPYIREVQLGRPRAYEEFCKLCEAIRAIRAPKSVEVRPGDIQYSAQKRARASR